jgi:iron complex outermembrane receptor protein
LYKRTTKDLLLYTQNPSFGFSNYDNYNVGTIENKGIEIAANVIPVRTDDLMVYWRKCNFPRFQITKNNYIT